MFKNDVFKLGYEAAKNNASTCLHDKEHALLEDMSDYEQHAIDCDDGSVDADGTCLMCGKTNLL